MPEGFHLIPPDGAPHSLEQVAPYFTVRDTVADDCCGASVAVLARILKICGNRYPLHFKHNITADENFLTAYLNTDHAGLKAHIMSGRVVCHTLNQQPGSLAHVKSLAKVPERRKVSRPIQNDFWFSSTSLRPLPTRF